MSTLYVVSCTVGRINSIIYPVEGGMEDWLYAAGWDHSPVKTCSGVGGDGAVTVNPYNPPRGTKNIVLSTQRRQLDAQAIPSRSLASPASGTALVAGTDDVAENRAIVFLVETSNQKKPLDSSLGGSEKVISILLLPFPAVHLCFFCLDTLF
jgi:hypothetical protein